MALPPSFKAACAVDEGGGGLGTEQATERRKVNGRALPFQWIRRKRCAPAIMQFEDCNSTRCAAVDASCLDTCITSPRPTVFEVGGFECARGDPDYWNRLAARHLSSFRITSVRQS